MEAISFFHPAVNTMFHEELSNRWWVNLKDGKLELSSMLSARRKSDGQTVGAYFERKTNGPFSCLQCNDEVILKCGRNRINHFAHVNPISCRFNQGESEIHRKCKLEIFLALKAAPGVRDTVLELPLEEVRPDVFAVINGIPVAIEVQISSLSVETIMRRTIDYFRRGIYVLWLLQWSHALDRARYAPKIWEKWIHATYYGRVYYWTQGTTVVSYHFEPALESVPKKTWYLSNGRKTTVGGYTQRLKRYRTAVRGETLDLLTDFKPKQRYWWSGEGITVPDAKLFMDDSSWKSFGN